MKREVEVCDICEKEVFKFKCEMCGKKFCQSCGKIFSIVRFKDGIHIDISRGVKTKANLIGATHICNNCADPVVSSIKENEPSEFPHHTIIMEVLKIVLRHKLNKKI